MEGHGSCEQETTGAICCWSNLCGVHAVAGNGKFFLSLLPPKKVLDAPEPVGAQLQFAPDQSEVVRLSEIMKDRPYHPSLTLQKALTRLAPTCRKLWNQMDWISGTVAQVWCRTLFHMHSYIGPNSCMHVLARYIQLHSVVLS